jgi:thiol-disulfide isomerase/thioredoxin
MTRRTPPAALALLLGASLLCGCAGGVSGSGDQGFVSGNGDVRVVAAADRQAPARVAGRSLDGREVSLSDYQGKVVVLPVWGSWCAPCRAEAPMLAAAAKDLADSNVAFLGIDSQDPETAGPRAFARNFAVSYPSIWDPDGSTLLAFHAGLSPKAIPSTLFVDEHGRVAAAVAGPITRTTLYDVVEEVSTRSASAGNQAGP